MSETVDWRDLVDRDTLRQLYASSNWEGARQTLSHVGAVVLTGTLLWLYRGTWWAVPLFAVHGTLVNFLYAGQHELSHNTVFRTRVLNEWVGRVFGFLLFYPRTFDLLQHMTHHRHTQDWGQDGELARPTYTLRTYLLWLTGVSYWYTRWRRILRFSVGIVNEPYLLKSRHPEMVREARWHLAGYALIAVLSILMHSWVAVLLWFAPMVIMKFTHQMQNTIEHLGRPHTDNMLTNTRSTRTNALVRWMAWQMPYHTAHHAFPGVPFYHLHKLNAILFTYRGAEPPAMTYWRFQCAVFKALARGTEADYPQDRAWIE
jgi:fatty acid desaturase